MTTKKKATKKKAARQPGEHDTTWRRCVKTQAELDQAVKDGLVACVHDGHVVLRGSSRAVLWESSSAVLYGSSRAVLWESSSAVLWESSSAVASKFVALQVHEGHTGSIKGGVVIYVKQPTTAEEWCDYNGVAVKDGVALLYKAVKADFTNGYNGSVSYAPGCLPEAPDWDGGKSECGGGLHFSPSPGAALDFYSDQGRRFVACPVRLADIVVQHPAEMPSKVKAQRVCAPVYEVDIDGKKVSA
jgi:hypothetical protein